MLTLNDGRIELWQWDTGRTLTVDADCSQVHFSNKVFGRSIDVDVVDGVAIVPDILLQTDKDLNVWAFVGTAENGYTKISKTFKVNRRNKPADYVFTPPDQTTLGELVERLGKIEESQDPDAIKNAVDEYLANNPIQTEEEDPTVPDWAKQPTKPKYTAQEVGAVATVNGTAPDENGNVEIEIPEASEPDMTGYATERYVQENYQPKGNYLTEVPEGYATEEFVKNKIAEAELGGEEVDLSGYAQKSELPTKVSELENDAGYLTEHQDLSDYAKKTELPVVPVQSVNGKTGSVKLSASDVGARPDNWTPTAQEVGALPSTYEPPNQTAEQVGADPKGTAAKAVSDHKTDKDAHNDIRLLIQGLTTRLNALANSTDTDLDQMAELVAYIKSNKSLIDGITTSKVSTADIVDNLTTNVSNKPLSAAQGVSIKALIDGLTYGKLDASKLQEAINDALAQAKASGEFNGKDGKDGASVTVKSVSESSADGGNNVVTFSDGKTVTIKNGSKGSSGSNGKDGADGKTPVKGTDYFTAADKTELVNAVIAALPDASEVSY